MSNKLLQVLFRLYKLIQVLFRLYEIYETVNDRSIFLKLRSDPTICRGNKLQRCYNVCNVFTNTPHKQTIKLALNLIFEKRSELRTARKQLRTEFVTSRTHFLLNGNYYAQTDDVGIGPALGPFLANLFMGYHEKIWLKELQTCGVVFMSTVC